MKEIRQIKEVVVMKSVEKNNNELSCTNSNGIFDTHLGKSDFYQSSLFPLFHPEHETELVYFLKNMGLITRYQHCNNCYKMMNWEPSSKQDLFEWKCLQCNIKKSIRENSPLIMTKCSFRDILKVLYLWCQGYDIQKIESSIAIQKYHIWPVIDLATKIALQYMKFDSPQWKLGGNDTIVLIDDYPEGFSNANSNFTILCVAEVKINVFPPTMWFEALDRTSEKSNDRNSNLQKCLLLLQSIVHENSILVLRENSSVCSYSDLLKSKTKFKKIISTQQLEIHNTPGQKLNNILAEIWNEALTVCEEAQHYNQTFVSSFLVSYMWRKRLGNESYQLLLNQIAAMVK